MTLEELYYISQIIASVAVLASLIYLAQQTRQNTLGQRAMMHQQRILQMQGDIYKRIEPALAEAILVAEKGDAAMTEVQFRQFLALQLTGLTSMEEQFRLHKSGLFDAAHWSTSRKTLALFLWSPGSRVMARMYKDLFDPEYAQLLDEIIAEVRTLPQRDRRATWTTMLEEELRLSTPAVGNVTP